MKRKNHDENKDVKLLSRKFVVNPNQKTITIGHNQIIGIRTWSRIDYLCHYCNYVIIFDDEIIKNKNNNNNDNEL